MSPTVLVGHVRLQVLGIMYQDINAAAKLYPLAVCCGYLLRWFKFIVSDIGTGRTIILDAIAVTAAWVIDWCTPDVNVLLGQFGLEVFCYTF